MSLIYGPVPSWRLGRSVGVDPISAPGKTCSFDCIYCQLGRTRHQATERREFVEASQLAKELSTVRNLSMDYITFSGTGEPTLAANLAELVAVVRDVLPGRPVAILTNASLIPRRDVRRDLALFDTVVAKMDAPDEALFRQINCPLPPYSLAEILLGIRRFREGFPGKLALQMMFIEVNRGRAAEMAEFARGLLPDEVQLNTPLRPSPVPPLNPAEMEEVEIAFTGLPVLNVYRSERPEVAALDEGEMRRRRPAGMAEL